MLTQFQTARRFVEIIAVATCLTGGLAHSTAQTFLDDIHGYWPLNEGTGTALNDFSNTQPPGALVQLDGASPIGLGPAGSMWVDDPVRGTVLGFTGNDAEGFGVLGHELLPVSDLTDGFTWSFWAKSDQGNNNDIILGNRYNTNNVDFATGVEGVPRQWVKFTGNQFEWRPSDVAANLNYADFGVQTDWMHHVVTRDGNVLRYYRNGVLTLTGGTLTQPIVVPMPIYLGGQGRENWRGYMDEVMLFQRALTTDEVALLHQLTRDGTSLTELLTPGPARIVLVTPNSEATGAAFDTEVSVTVVAGMTQIDEESIEFTVNGQIIPATVATSLQLSPEVSLVTITVPAPVFPNLYEPLSTVNASINLEDTGGTTLSQSWSFQVQHYANVEPSWAVPDVDTSERGFLVRTHILDNRRHVVGDRGARTPPAENQLAGRIAPNIANPTPFTRDGYFVETKYINYNQTALVRDDSTSSEGMFGAAETFIKLENPIPGIEGATVDFNKENGYTNPPELTGSDHMAAEILTYLDLPQGIVRLGVNSDDGFRLTVSPLGAPADKFGVLVSEFDGGRGSSATQGTEARLVVQQAGMYAFRLMWYEGQGGNNAEWYGVAEDGTPILINDPDEPSAIKAYTSRTGTAPAHVSILTPFPFGSTLDFAYPDDSIYLEITHGTTPVDLESIELQVNGQTMAPATSQSGNKTTVELAPPGGVWPPGDLAVELTFNADAAVSHNWTVPMISYVTLEECLRTDVGTGTDPGMLWRTHWIRTGDRANTVPDAEDQLANRPNDALPGSVNGYYEIPNVNFNQITSGDPTGLFGQNRTPPFRGDAEFVVPGLPLDAPTDPNYIVGEALAYIEFPAAGMYFMGVNRDDGFLLTTASTEGGRDLVNGPNVQQIGIYSGGGGTDANNVQMNGFMPIYVPQAGVWPFRLLWYEGTGGGNVEWFQTDKQTPFALINDSLNPESLRAFRSRSAEPPTPDSALCATVVVDPTISVERTEGGIILTFEGTLQEADEVEGPYSNVVEDSPLEVSTTGTAKFYRAVSGN